MFNFFPRLRLFRANPSNLQLVYYICINYNQISNERVGCISEITVLSQFSEPICPYLVGVVRSLSYIIFLFFLLVLHSIIVADGYQCYH